jgi:hypothetical protein
MLLEARDKLCRVLVLRMAGKGSESYAKDTAEATEQGLYRGMLCADVGVEVCLCGKLCGAEKADRGRERGRRAMGRSDMSFEGGAVPEKEAALTALEDRQTGVLAVRVGTDFKFRAGEATDAALDIGDDFFKGQAQSGEYRNFAWRACALWVRTSLSLSMCTFVVTVAKCGIGVRAGYIVIAVKWGICVAAAAGLPTTTAGSGSVDCTSLRNWVSAIAVIIVNAGDIVVTGGGVIVEMIARDAQHDGVDVVLVHGVQFGRLVSLKTRRGHVRMRAIAVGVLLLMKGVVGMVAAVQVVVELLAVSVLMCVAVSGVVLALDALVVFFTGATAVVAETCWWGRGGPCGRRG